MQPEDIIRLKQTNEQTSDLPRIENEQKQLYTRLGRLLKARMLTPTDKTTRLLHELIKQVETTS